MQPVQFIHEDLFRDDGTPTVIEKIFHSNMQALRDTQRVLDAAALDRAADAIIGARRVELYGVGSAAPIAEDANYRLLRIGIESKVVTDSHVQAISASLVTRDMAVITISHSGSTHETLTTTRLASPISASRLSSNIRTSFSIRWRARRTFGLRP